jgi:hypothetical protein
MQPVGVERFDGVVRRAKVVLVELLARDQLAVDMSGRRAVSGRRARDTRDEREDDRDLCMPNASIARGPL